MEKENLFGVEKLEGLHFLKLLLRRAIVAEERSPTISVSLVFKRRFIHIPRLFRIHYQLHN